MVLSAEQRWNEGSRAHGPAVTAVHNAGRARNTAMIQHASRNNEQTRRNLARARANYNRTWAHYNRVVRQVSNAYRELVRRYYPTGLRVRNQNEAMRALVPAAKARVRHNARVRVLSAVLPHNLAVKIARLAI